MQIDDLLEQLAQIGGSPETFRALVRSEEGRLTPEEAKAITLLRFTLQAQGGETGENLFFMTGLFKAGTTWLGLLLNAHPGLCCPEKEMHSFSAQISELYTGKRLSELPASEAKVWGENILDARRAALFWQIVSQSNKPSAKRLGGRGPVADIRGLIRAFPKIRIPVILRDGRDVAVSAAFFHQTFYGQSWERFFEDEGKTRINADYAAGWGWQFKQFYSQALAAGAEFPQNVLVARYEDMLADPEAEMARIYGFLKVADDPGTVRACVAACRFERLSGGRKPGEADSGSFFRKGVAGDWRQHFTPEATARFKEVAGDFLIESGYERDGGWHA